MRLWRWVAGFVIGVVGLAVIIVVTVKALLLPRLDAMLAAAMRRELSLPAEATVQIERGSFNQTLQGFLPRSFIESPAAVLDDIPVEYVLFRTADIDFNLRQIIKGEKAEITHVGAAELTLRVSTPELKSRLIPLIEKEGLKNVQIDFDADSIKVTAQGEAKLSAQGHFQVLDNNRVGFALTDIEFAQLNITVSNLVLPVEDVLPPLDLGGMFANIVIDELHVTSAYLEITAHTESLAAGQVPNKSIEVF